MTQDRNERDEYKKDELDMEEWDPLNTPQISQSREAQRRLGRGAEMPGLYEEDRADTEDGEEELTNDERLASIQKNLNLIRQGVSEETLKAKEVANNFKNLTRRKDE